MGHCGNDVLVAIIPKKRRMEESKVVVTKNCDSCEQSKVLRPPHKLKRFVHRATLKPLDPVYSDVVGPQRDKCIRNLTYFVSLLDDSSSYYLVRIVAKKREVANAVVRWDSRTRTYSTNACIG